MSSGITNPCHVAHNGLQALAMPRGEDGRSRVVPPYIVIPDLRMPKMNGIEFLRELRRDPKLHSSVVFVFTTSSSESDRETAYEYNVAGFISKDRPADSLRDMIRLIDCYRTVVQLPH